jgi:hypothetical protein
MKKLTTVLLFTVVSFATLKAQWVVNDPQANASLMQQTFLEQIMKAYQSLSTRIQNSTLTQVISTARTVDNQLDLFQQALDVADQFQQLQGVKDFFSVHKKIVQKIQEVNSDFSSVRGFIRPAYAKTVTRNLDDAYVLAAKSISVVSTSFIRKQINMADRLSFLNEAQKYIDQAVQKIDAALKIVREAKYYYNMLDQASNYYKAIF